VHAVVGDVAGDHQADGRDEQHGGVVGVGVPCLDRLQAVALQLEALGGDRLVNHRTLGNEPGKILVPQLGAALRGLYMHQPDRAFGGVGDRAGETAHQHVGTEPMVAVPVRGVDISQPLARPLDPVADPADLFAGIGRVDQHGIPLAEDQRGRERRGHYRPAIGQPLGPVPTNPVGNKYLVAQFGHDPFLSEQAGIWRCRRGST
jgi:hypothetical protein